MIKTTKAIENKMTVIRRVAKSYHVLKYITELQELCSLIYPGEDFKHLGKFKLHELINSAILEKYPSEQGIKYALFKEYYNKDVIGAFEMNVNSSRLDFLTINGVTTSYEIKSSLDTLQKLSKQSADYLKAFEYNKVIIDQCHLECARQMLPSYYGIVTICDGVRKTEQSGAINCNIDAEFQLRLLTKKELNRAFKINEFERILNEYDANEINLIFKNTLKLRYVNRWNFIKSRAAQILPLDIQFFFNSNIEPISIYGAQLN